MNNLELISRKSTTGPSTYPPLLFLHGAYAGAWCYDYFWLPYFADQGFDVYALSFRGHGNSLPFIQNSHNSQQDYTDDLAAIIAKIKPEPIVIAHSMGAWITLNYLNQHPIAKTIFLAPVPAQGVFSSMMHMMTHSPHLLWSLNIMQNFATHPDLQTLKALLFSDHVEQQTLSFAEKHFSYESHLALTQMLFSFMHHTQKPKNNKSYVMYTSNDRLIPSYTAEQMAKELNATTFELKSSGHMLMLDHEWKAAANQIIDWIKND